MDEKKVKSWIDATAKLEVAKSTELELRNSICEYILSGNVKGSKIGVVGPYILTATAKLNTKIDKDLLKAIWKSLDPAEKACFKFDPKLVAKTYNALDDKFKTIHRALTNKPGTPGLKLKGVKK